MISIKGKFNNGKIELYSVPKIQNNIDVIITFLDTERIFSLDENKFWNLLELLDWNQFSDEKILEPLLNELKELSIENICQFKEIFSEKLYHLDTKEHAKHIGKYSYKADSTFSPDIFLFARALVVGKGKDFYYRVLNNPKLMPKNSDFEAILYVPSEAYKFKTNQEMNYVPKFIPETFYNKLGWNDEFDFNKMIFGD